MQKVEDKVEGNGLWIVGDKCTIADLACFSWINWAEWAGISLDEFPEIKKWVDKINDRPAVKRGLDVPKTFKMKEKMKTKEEGGVCEISFKLGDEGVGVGC